MLIHAQGPSGPSDPSLQQLVVDEHPYQLLREELCQFMEQTTQRLAALAEEMASERACDLEHSEPVPCLDEIESDPEALVTSPIESPPENHETAQPTQDAKDDSDSQPVKVPTPTEPADSDNAATAVNEATNEFADDQDDPLSRLAAIKSRLAEKLQNES